MKPSAAPGRPEIGIAIIGPGRVGQALGKLLVKEGFPVLFVVARRSRSGRRAVRFIGGGKPLLLRGFDEWLGAQVILLTVSDAALPGVVRALAKRVPPKGDAATERHGRTHHDGWRGKIILHTCGSLPSSVLRPLKRRGAAIGSLHPFQTIPNPAAGVRNLRECFWSVEGDAEAVRVAARWIKALRGIAFRVRRDRRSIYHLAAFLTCPTVVTLMDRSLRLLRQAGVPAGIARPMLGQFVAETAGNFARLGARRALTGPAARGDWPTLRRHIAALRRFSPDTIPLYRVLVTAMARLAGRALPRGVC